MSVPGPRELGRGVVVEPGGALPAPFADAERVVVGARALAEPTAAIDALQVAWSSRRPIVVELGVGAEALREPERCDRAPYQLTPRFEFARERLAFLVWANNYDARSGEPVWWHGRKAARTFARDGARESGPADLALPHGRSVFVDGGPSHPPELGDGTPVVHRWSAELGVLRAAGHQVPATALAPDQLAAVMHGTGPARVVAPAGSGKTRVLTERLRHLVVDWGVPPGAVTALAFNTRAADELRDRCSEFVSGAGPHIRTLNSIGLWICNEADRSRRWRVAEEPEVRDLVQSVFDVRRQSNADTTAPYLDAMSMIRLGLVTPSATEAELPDARGMAAGFEDYRRALGDAGVVDFDEQIYRAIETLLRDPVTRRTAQQRCRYLLVDEFQDLTPAHLLLIRLLSAPAYDCFGVGDDDQVIYGYTGATPEFLLRYPEYFPGAGDHGLEVNYRCPPAVVRAARHLLSYNKRRVPKEIRAREGRVDEPVAGSGSLVVRTADPEELAHVLVETVEAWRAAGVEPSDIAVLARVNSALLPAQVALAESGVPSSAPLTTQVLARTGMRTALAYLRIGQDPGRIDRQDVLETIRRPSRGIAPMVTDMVTRSRTTSIADVRRLAGRLTCRDVPKLEAYATDLEAVADACRLSAADALRAIRLGIGLGDTMDVLDTSRRAVDRSTHADDLIALESVAALHPEVATFESWLRAVLRRPAPEGPSVLLSTVHRIKGREWGHVVVFGASRGILPHRLSDDEEGERRVFHVALTRASAQAVVLADAQAPSIFVAELDGSRRVRVPRPGVPPAAARPAAASDRVRSSADPAVPVRLGELIEQGGLQGEIVELTAAEAAEAVEALRTWRREAARREAVPAYVLLNDRELEGVAARRPSTLAELASCRGMGAIRLERWGDEILAVLDQMVAK